MGAGIRRYMTCAHAKEYCQKCTLDRRVPYRRIAYSHLHNKIITECLDPGLTIKELEELP